MQLVLKYLFFIFLLPFVILLYLIYTPHGNSIVYTILSDRLSKKSDLLIEVQSLDIRHYPKISIAMHIEKKAKLILWGDLNGQFVDMDYTLTSECIATEACQIDDAIDITGNVKGPFSKLTIKGKGNALDGQVSYSTVKYPEKVEDVSIRLDDVNSSKLLKLLGQSAYIKGKANAQVDFSVMDEKHKKGHITYSVDDRNFKGVPLDMKTKVTIVDDKQTFDIVVLSPYFTLNVFHGEYDQAKRHAEASYMIDIIDLSKLEGILGYKYIGTFEAEGEFSYSTFFKVTGHSKSFGGDTKFHFEKDGLKVDLNNIWFEKIMARFPFPSLLSARANGNIYYNFRQKTLVVNTKLKNAKFIPSKLVDTIRKKANVNLLKETFYHSNLDLTYHNSNILGELLLNNEHDNEHVYLTSTKIETLENTINGYFDFKVQGEEFSGKVYGLLDDPKVNLNMQKLVRYKMDKQVDKMIGKNNRKIMESMPMGNVAKDMATDMGKSFMKVFF
jgi:hypothetical protein